MRFGVRAVGVFALVVGLCLVAVPAWAHVTVRVDNPAPEAFAKYTVRVPNESDTAATTSIEVELPEGFEEARVQPQPGWDLSVSNGVLTIEGGRIEPGEFQEFSFSGQNPASEGELVFPSIQTYDDGEEARWVGEPDAEQPAPVVEITGAAEGHGGSSEDAGHGGSEAATEAAAAGDDADGDDDGASTLVPTVLSVLALVLAGAALFRAGRSQPTG